ncbi:MAG: four helix bundle protein, partial [Candidatus Andersenbacteria bacterium]|nr:four helix bundle protein [Candidatus Andersenbacteria bacterium]
FLPPAEKLPYIQLAIRKQDALKVLLEILWNTKSLDDKKYLAVSVPVAEIGQRLGGWHGQITKKMQQANIKNSPQKRGEK